MLLLFKLDFCKHRTITAFNTGWRETASFTPSRKSPDDGKTIIAVLEDKTNIEQKNALNTHILVLKFAPAYDSLTV